VEARGRQMSGKGYDPWSSALIWYLKNVETTTDIWRPGIVQKREPGLTSNQWIFHILPSSSDPSIVTPDDSSSSSSILELTTISLDTHHLEYKHLKRRDSKLSSSTVALSLNEMTSLAYLNEPEMIECLRLRYAHGQIYTNIGPILVALNPFELLNSKIYALETILTYFQQNSPTHTTALPPHVYTISSNAYKKMFVDQFDFNKRENQSILVNGESGAGKTESTKQILRYLSIHSTHLTKTLNLTSTHDRPTVTLSSSNKLVESTLQEDKNYELLINALNPITESFGNAKTLRNNNSSRFGKFIELCYHGQGTIIGAYIQTYLLETIRITSQHYGERNYHIFYELYEATRIRKIKEMNTTTMTTIDIGPWVKQPTLSPESGGDGGGGTSTSSIYCLEDFFYTNQSNQYHRDDQESDADNYHRLYTALTTISLSETHINSLMNILVGILHLGNLQFVNSTVIGEDVAHFSSHTDTQNHLHHCCECFGLESSGETLLHLLTKREMKVAGNIIVKNINCEGAYAVRDGLARTTYELLFKYLMEQVNQALAVDGQEETASVIGILDIFGFEYFEKNSFEQLW
jgi:myosin heavy subunit